MTILIVTIFVLAATFIILRKTIVNSVKAKSKLLLFQSIINSSDDFIVSKDFNGVILSWNPGAEAIFGYTSLEIINRPISSLILPSRLLDEHAIARQVQLGNYVNKHDTQWRHKDGHVIDISLTISPIRNEHGTVIGACNIGRDITSLKKIVGELSNSAQQSREMLDLINEGVIILDSNFRFTYLNKRYAEMMHREPESLIGKNVWAEFPDAVGTPTFTSIQRAMAERRYFITEDCTS